MKTLMRFERTRAFEMRLLLDLNLIVEVTVSLMTVDGKLVRNLAIKNSRPRAVDGSVGAADREKICQRM